MKVAHKKVDFMPFGKQSNTWYHGTTAPDNALGANGNYYLNTVTGNIYKKVSGAWGSPIGSFVNTTTFDTALDTKADLVEGKVPAAQLPSYVDDVLEYANLAAFPATGETGKIYVALDTNKIYRWSGSAYVVISDTLALGETSATAYRGDRGKTAYDHSQATGNPHGTTKENVGLGNVDNTSDANKPISDATAAALGDKADASALDDLPKKRVIEQTIDASWSSLNHNLNTFDVIVQAYTTDALRQMIKDIDVRCVDTNSILVRTDTYSGALAFVIIG